MQGPLDLYFIDKLAYHLRISEFIFLNRLQSIELLFWCLFCNIDLLGILASVIKIINNLAELAMHMHFRVKYPTRTTLNWCIKKLSGAFFLPSLLRFLNFHNFVNRCLAASTEPLHDLILLFTEVPASDHMHVKRT